MFFLEQFLHYTFIDIFLIGAILGAVAMSAVGWWWSAKILRKRQIWLRLFSSVVLLPALVLFYAAFIEPNLLITKMYPVDLPALQLETPVRIVVIGDMQARAALAPSYVPYLVERVNKLNPDYILWVGDLIEGGTENLHYFEAFAELEAKHGIYGVLGNHDYRREMNDPFTTEFPAEVEIFLEKRGMTVLRNEVATSSAQGLVVTIAGTEDLWSEKARFEGINQVVRQTKPQLSLLVTHQPQTVLKNDDYGLYDLTVAGHCHAGQLNFPGLNRWLKTPIVPPGCFDEPDQAAGLFTAGGHLMMVTPGVGSLKLRTRLFAPPEISVVEVK